jgi:hypothetical protein
MSIDKTILQYKDFDTLQQFAQAQQTTIIQISKKNQRLEEEVIHLKKLLESSVPLLKEEGKSLGERLLTSSEEAICTIQLEKLRDISMGRELTLEEARRVEIFSKVLNVSRNMPKTIEIKNKQLSSQELLAIVENNDVIRK